MIDGHDVDDVDGAIAKATLSTDKPTLIVCKTSIGKGSPNRANTAKAHGEPLGGDEIKLTRDAIGWSHDPFVIPEEVPIGMPRPKANSWWLTGTSVLLLTKRPPP